MERNKQTQQERIYDILADGAWHSTGELMQKTGIGYPPRRIYDLRRRGFAILSRPSEDSEYDEYRLLPTESEPKQSPAIVRELAQMKADAKRIENEGKPILSREEQFQLSLIK